MLIILNFFYSTHVNSYQNFVIKLMQVLLRVISINLAALKLFKTMDSISNLMDIEISNVKPFLDDTYCSI